MVKLQNSFHLPWAMEKEVQVHSKVINRIDLSIDKVENETFPHITLVDSASEEIGKDSRYNTKSAIEGISTFVFLF